MGQEQPGRRPEERADSTFDDATFDDGAASAVTVVDVPIGRRVMVVSDLLLRPDQMAELGAMARDAVAAVRGAGQRDVEQLARLLVERTEGHPDGRRAA